MYKVPTHAKIFKRSDKNRTEKDRLTNLWRSYEHAQKKYDKYNEVENHTI